MTRDRNYKIKAKIFKWTGKGAWFFVRIEKETAENIKDNFGMYAAGWGSLPVNVMVGNSTWKTSIFPDKKETYLLPIKSQIRKAENIKEGNELNIKLEVIVKTTQIPAPTIN